MRLFLMQHGDSLPEEVNRERPLSGRGREDVARMARFLSVAGCRASRVYHSGKNRAWQTAEIMAEHLAPGVSPQVMSGISPNDPVAPVAQQVQGFSDDALIAGHQPFMGRLVAQLVAGNAELAVVSYRQGSVACVEKNAEGGWSLCWMMRPELLAA
ncbi:MAG: phosphohistidine phosphatase SixA [Betaproteobacteria bacterium]|nr:phosphohistidine phosphatase SixA [Betaproteobacteria bacterium]